MSWMHIISNQQENNFQALQFSGHKYPYVGSLDIVDTDKKYIKEIENSFNSEMKELGYILEN